MTQDVSEWKIGWGLTSRCNMRCPFCYSLEARQKPQELPLSVAMDFIDANALAIHSINYGTGECSLSENWFRLSAYIRERYPHIRQAVTTNGTLAEAIRADSSQKESWRCSIDEVDVSLDFAHAAEHNALRQHRYAFQWALETLEVAAQEGKSATIVVVGYAETLSIKNLDALFELAARYNAFLRINILRSSSHAAHPPPSYDTVMQALLWICRTHQVVSLCDPLFGSLFAPASVRPEETGITSLRILPDGSITPSTYLVKDDWKAGNILEKSLLLSNIRLSQIFQQITTAPLPQECRVCSMKETCRGGAVDRRILSHKTLTARDPYCPDVNHRAFPAPIALRQYQGTEGAPSVHDGYLPTLIFAPESMSM